jgi:hypothetical protein
MDSNKAKGNKKLKEIEALEVGEQAKHFLRTFVMSFKGNFDEILNLAERFVTYRTRKPSDKGAVSMTSLEEADLYRFLEAEDKTVTAGVFRSELPLYDIERDENNRSFSFIVFALWYFKKNVALLAPVEGDGEVDPMLLQLLEEALNEYQKVVDARKEREAKMARLEETAALGGVKGLSAKNELDQMISADQLARNKAEITAAAKRRQAQKAVDVGSDSAAAREKALKAELAKVEMEKKKKEEAEKREQEEKRNKLKAKAAMFNQAPTEPAPIMKKNPSSAIPSSQPAKKWGQPQQHTAPVTNNATVQSKGPIETGASTKSAMEMFKNKDAELKKQQEEPKQEPKVHVAAKKPVTTQPAHDEPAHVQHQSHHEEHHDAPDDGVVRAKVVYAHTAGSEKEITLELGQILVIHTQDASGWWDAENENGERGWIPSNYVEIQ